MSILSKLLSKVSGNKLPEVDLAKLPLMEFVLDGQFNKLLATLSDSDINKLIGILLNEAKRRKKL